MFVMAGCPHCKKALSIIDDLKKEPAFADAEIEMIDETEQPALAETFDYWYVPTLYVDGEKLHEGVPSEEKLRAVFEAAAR